MRRFAIQLRSLPAFQHTTFDFYAWDARNQGDSARLNADHIHIPTCKWHILYLDHMQIKWHNNIDGWLDNAMDTVQVINEMGLKKNYDKVIGVGHSFGGSAMWVIPSFLPLTTYDDTSFIDYNMMNRIIAEFFFPHIFDGLCILEAVIAKQFVPYKIRSNFPAIKTTLKRRDTWSSR